MSFIQKAYKPRKRIQHRDTFGTGLTQKSFMDECDINKIVNHWLKTGEVPIFNNAAQYGDVSQYPMYAESMQLIAEADQAFALLSKEHQEQFKTPLGYLEALQAAALAERQDVGTDDPLDVTVPTDTKQPQSGQKGDNDGKTFKNAAPPKSDSVPQNGDG